MNRSDKFTAEERLSITEQGYTTGKLLVDIGMSNVFGDRIEAPFIDEISD